MKSKWTILLAVLMLMLGLAVTQVNAQGFSVSKSETDVALHGRNQMMGAIRLDYVDTGGNIDDGRTIKIVYGGLYITSTSAEVTADLDCMGFMCGTDTNAGRCGGCQRRRHRYRDGYHQYENRQACDGG